MSKSLSTSKNLESCRRYYFTRTMQNHKDMGNRETLERIKPRNVLLISRWIIYTNFQTRLGNVDLPSTGS